MCSRQSDRTADKMAMSAMIRGERQKGHASVVLSSFNPQFHFHFAFLFFFHTLITTDTAKMSNCVKYFNNRLHLTTLLLDIYNLYNYNNVIDRTFKY